MITGIIIGHKDIAHEFMKALESISGPSRHIHYLSNSGLSTRELASQIKECCEGNDCKSILFIDVYGGSCWRAAKMALTPDIRIVTGLNLPMLLSFVNKRQTVPFEDLPSVLAQDGIRGITAE